jgi:ferredoxin
MTPRQKRGAPGLEARCWNVFYCGVGRMKIVVDHDECEANAVCVGILPDVFEVDDEDNLTVHQEYPPADILDDVRKAVDSCPKRALALKEVDE